MTVDTYKGVELLWDDPEADASRRFLMVVDGSLTAEEFAKACDEAYNRFIRNADVKAEPHG